MTKLRPFEKLSYITSLHGFLDLSVLSVIIPKVFSLQTVFHFIIMKEICVIICILTKTHKMIFNRVQHYVVFVKLFCDNFKVSP